MVRLGINLIAILFFFAGCPCCQPRSLEIYYVRSIFHLLHGKKPFLPTHFLGSKIPQFASFSKKNEKWYQVLSRRKNIKIQKPGCNSSEFFFSSFKNFTLHVEVDLCTTIFHLSWRKLVSKLWQPILQI